MHRLCAVSPVDPSTMAARDLSGGFGKVAIQIQKATDAVPH